MMNPLNPPKRQIGDQRMIDLSWDPSKGEAEMDMISVGASQKSNAFASSCIRTKLTLD